MHVIPLNREYHISERCRLQHQTSLCVSLCSRCVHPRRSSDNGGTCGVSVTAPAPRVDEREEMLFGYVRQLEHRVEDLRMEVEVEMAWNAQLEKMLQD